jgi:hypothetical protein
MHAIFSFQALQTIWVGPKNDQGQSSVTAYSRLSVWQLWQVVASFAGVAGFSVTPIVNLHFHCRRSPPRPGHVGDHHAFEEAALSSTPPPLRTVTLRCALENAGLALARLACSSPPTM